LFAIEPGGLLGLPAARLFPGADARWLKGSSREPREFRIEAEGRQLTLKAESLPLRDEDGVLMGSLVMAEATSESEDGEFQKNIDRLVSLGELSAYVAHEIRNPLTGIRTTVQYVGSKFKPNDARREDLEDVIKELDRIEQIITGLLMFARPPAARPQSCDLRQVLEKTLDLLELQLGDAEVTLFKDYAEEDEEIPPVYADPDLTPAGVPQPVPERRAGHAAGGRTARHSGVRRYRTRRSVVDVSFRTPGWASPRSSWRRSSTPSSPPAPWAPGLVCRSRCRSFARWRGHHRQEQRGGGATLRVSFPVPAEPPGPPED